ncbi:MAG: hypothetical protein ACREXW_09725 [Gammaproteobacteria bacterium]
MDLSKEIVRQYVFVVAVNAGMMSEDLAKKIKEYDFETFKLILQRRVNDLRQKAAQSEQEFFDAEYYESGAKTVEEVLNNLDKIIPV